MKSVDEASREVLAAFSPVGVERLSLLSAFARFTAEPLYARRALPPFDNSAMDGYAFRASETSAASEHSPLALRVVGESRAGGGVPPPLSSHTAMRIFTGAALPEGADAVELQENVARERDRVLLRSPLTASQNVRRRGFDVEEGALMLPPHSELLAGELGLLASQDIAAVSVFRRPRVAIVCTGDELRDIGETERPGSIVSSNSYALAAQVLEAGAEPWVLPTALDTRHDVARALADALTADVVVLSGGVSVGDYDVVREGLAGAGIALAFWKVQMKPGKPLSFALAGRVPVLGLPGNPVSTWVTFELFVRPGLRKMLGAHVPQRPAVRVRMSEALRRKPGRTEFARATLTRDVHGYVAHLLPQQSSGAMSSLVGVGALVEIPADCAQLAADSELNALVLRPLPA